MDLEDSLTRQAVEGTLKEDAASRPQKTILREKKMTAEHLGIVWRQRKKHFFFFKSLLVPFVCFVVCPQKAVKHRLFLTSHSHPACFNLHFLPPQSFLFPSHQFQWLASLWSCHRRGDSSHTAFCHHMTLVLWVGAPRSPTLVDATHIYNAFFSFQQLLFNTSTFNTLSVKLFFTVWSTHAQEKCPSFLVLSLNSNFKSFKSS